MSIAATAYIDEVIAREKARIAAEEATGAPDREPRPRPTREQAAAAYRAMCEDEERQADAAEFEAWWRGA